MMRMSSPHSSQSQTEAGKGADRWMTQAGATAKQQPRSSPLSFARPSSAQSHSTHAFDLSKDLKLLSDETPPEDMDGSWDLEDLDDDMAQPQLQAHVQDKPGYAAETTLRPSTSASSLATQPHPDDNKSLASTPHQHRRDSPRTVVSKADSLVQPGGPQRPATRTIRDDMSEVSGSSECSVKINDDNDTDDAKTVATVKATDSDIHRYPWRDSKLDNIFTTLSREYAQQREERVSGSHVDPKSRKDRSSIRMTGSSTGSGSDRASSQQKSVSFQEESSSISFGDIMDALNKTEETTNIFSKDEATSWTRGSSKRYTEARERLARLSPRAKLDTQDHAAPAANPIFGKHAHLKEDELHRRRTEVIKAAMHIDPNDNRSRPSADGKLQMRQPMQFLDKDLVATPVAIEPSTHSWPLVTKPSQLATMQRHRSQSSKDTELGDRASTASRDSVYRDSLSGSTLGSAYPGMMDAVGKLDMANIFASAKTSYRLSMNSQKTDMSVAPVSVEQTTSNLVFTPRTSHTLDHALLRDKVEDKDQTPRAVRSSSSISRRDNTSAVSKHSSSILPPSVSARRNSVTQSASDPSKAIQYAHLARKGLSKQSSSFVEQLANATDSALRVGDNSLKSTPSPASRKTEVGSSLGQTPIRANHQVSQAGGASSSKTANVKAEEAHDDDEQGDDNNDGADSDDDNESGESNSMRMESAFNNLENIGVDTSLTIEHVPGKQTRKVRPIVDTSDYSSAVALSSKSKRRGEYSLKFEDQEDDDASNKSAVQSHSVAGGSIANTSFSAANPTVNTSTMLPEQASFSHAEGHLLRIITALHPWDEWDQVLSLDLKNREVESTIRLDHLVPNLDTLILDDNQMSYLTGVPRTIKTLKARSNQLSDLTNFNHLSNLQYLDISHNGIEDLTGLASLVHLRELIAEGNNIRTVAALQQMDGLIRLDVSHNALTSLDFGWCKLNRLEYLDASHNQISQLESMESLVGLIHANLAHNVIEDVTLVTPLKRLRILRLSENKLLQFDAKSFPGLRTLYLDDNRLNSLENCQTLTKLENFSARDQEGEGIAIDMTEFVDSRKLYLSGNPIHSLDFTIGFYRLEYLEICAGCLSDLPDGFANLMPNLRGLNLSYNELDSLIPLAGLHRLRRLVFVGNRLKSFSAALAILKCLRSLVTLDLRHNPLTSNMYPVMSVNQGSKYQDTYRTNQNSATEQDWRRRDLGFRRALPDAMYIKRSVYRSALIKNCPRLAWFDGGEILAKERERIPIVLGNLMDTVGRDYALRREEEEEAYFYDEEEEELNSFEIRQHNQHHFEDGFYALQADGFVDERDPEDISEGSRRQSSIASGSVSSGEHSGSRSARHAPRAVPSRSNTGAVATIQQQHTPMTAKSQARPSPHPIPAHLQAMSSPGFHLSSPSPRRVSKSHTSLYPQQQQHFVVRPQNRASVHLSNRSTQQMSNNDPTQQQQQLQHLQQSQQKLHQSAQYQHQNHHHQQQQQQQQKQSQHVRSHEHDDTAHATYQPDTRQEDHDAREISIESAGSDMKSAVKSWRDEVNEVSNHRELVQSPEQDLEEAVPEAESEAKEFSTPTKRPTSSQRLSLGPKQMSKSGFFAEGILQSSPRQSTLLMPQQRPPRVRSMSSQRIKLPAPSVVLASPRNSYQLHSRDPSDAAAALAGGTTSALFGSTGTIGRGTPRSATMPTGAAMVASGSIGGGQGMGSPAAYVELMTHSTPTIQRPSHLRRRSMAAYPSLQIHTRRRELLGDGAVGPMSGQFYNSPQPMHHSLSGLMLASPAGSPSYFNPIHYNGQMPVHSSLQSPQGYGKTLALAGLGLGGSGGSGMASGRSVPNTPSKGGRSSRVSQQGYPFQTLARDMEREETE